MKKYKIVLLSGDGIGPEISEVSKKVLKKLSKNHNFDIEIIEKLFGGIAYEKYGTPAPDETLDQCKKSDAVLLACVGDIKYDSLARELRPESGLLKLRSALNLFANIRPVKIRKSLLDASTLKKEIVEHVDLIVVRELIGGIYFGKPRGSSENTSKAKSVPIVPPNAIAPSIFFSLHNFKVRDFAPFADAIIASFSLPKSIISLFVIFACSATSCFE